ncbi:MAG: hypothetical protein WBW74_14490 [Xanthobacteraceae bacterium]
MTPQNAPPRSAIDRGADEGPDRFDLLLVEHAAPRRHLALAVEDRADEAVVLLRSQAAQIESDAAAGVAQTFAMAVGAVVGVDLLSGCDLRALGKRAGPPEPAGPPENKIIALGGGVVD